MSITRITPPSGFAVSLEEAKLHLRVLGGSEDALISALIVAATEDAEGLMQRAVLPQVWRLSLDAFPCWCIRIPLGNVTAVQSVRYAAAETGTLTTMPSADYQLDSAAEGAARLAPAYGKAWPAARCQLAAVQVDFTAGWASAAAVPELVKAWIKLRIGALYENRQQWTEGRAIQSNDFIDRLLDRYRIVTL